MLAAPLVVFLYVGGYGAARAGHVLVRYSSGCISKAELHPDFRASNMRCAEFREADHRRGRTLPQLAFAPAVAVEEAIRGAR
jgi:hypothetical protein